MVRPARPRRTVQVRFSDGQIYEAPVGTPLHEFFQAVSLEVPAPVVAARVNGELRELTYPVMTDIDVAPVTMASMDGMRIYRRSLSFLLVTAAQELFPEAQVVVDHSLTSGGYYCRVEGWPRFSEVELARLEAWMRESVAEDVPIVRERVPLEQAVALFQARGEEDMLRLLAHRRKDYLTLCRLHSTQDCFHGYMVPSTGYLRYFALFPFPPGFILQFPRQFAPTVLLPYRDYPKLRAVFNESGQWLEVMGVKYVGWLNDAIEAGRMEEVILVAEALHQQRIAEIAAQIARQCPQVRVVLIAGPSASGKTTFAKRLAVQLLANRIRPLALSLDDYFLDRADTPRDQNGAYDFESFRALDLALFNDQLLRLMDGQAVTLPHYDFRTGTRQAAGQVSIGPDHVILIEGIHGLNPDLVVQVPPERIYRIYVSAMTHLNLDRHNRIPTTDTRLIRRIVRDARSRGHTAQQTISRWDRVRRGEDLHIFPYQENADVMFNSALVYELSVLKSLVEPLLLQIRPHTPEYVEAVRLLAFLDWFRPYPADIVPSTSILREFIGGSILQDFQPWRQRNGK
jgi:uridine kinase